MVRWLSAGLCVLAVLMVSAPGASAGGAPPVLGWKRAFMNGEGFGAVQPRTVYLGGDPTGEVSMLRWHRWGRAKTVGFGHGWCPRQSVAAGYYCTASLHVYGLTTCRGRRAYRMMSFYFKPGVHRHWIAGSTWNICTGQSAP